jgi:hypothetical protein
MISKYLEPHQRFQLIQVNKWFQQLTKENKLNCTVVYFVFSNPSGVKIYYENRKTVLENFLEMYKALLPWINSNNVELTFLTAERFLELRYDHSSNFTINMLILNYWVCTITKPECLKAILNSLELTILSLENHEPIISNNFLENLSQTVPEIYSQMPSASKDSQESHTYELEFSKNSPKICSQMLLITDDLLDVCSEFPRLQFLQVGDFVFPLIWDLEKTHFKNVIFERMYSGVQACIHMPLCLEKFYMGLDLCPYPNPGYIGFHMNQCEYIKEL